MLRGRSSPGIDGFPPITDCATIAGGRQRVKFSE
jgi:hypothetical protein